MSEKIYYRVEDYEAKLLNIAKEYTRFRTYGDFIDIEQMWGIIEELLDEIGDLREQIDTLEHDNTEWIDRQLEIRKLGE